MFVSKNDFIDNLVGIARKEEKYLKKMEDTFRRKAKTWGSFDWSYVKDSEMCIKTPLRAHIWQFFRI